MGGFLSRLGGAFIDSMSPGGVRGQQHERFDENQKKQQQDQRNQDFDMKLFDHMNEMGALPVVGGAVKAPMYDTSAPADMPDLVTTRPADKSRVFTHKAADGQTVQWELPDQATQQRRGLYEHMQQTMGPVQSQIRGAENEQAGEKAAATYGGAARGKNVADQENRRANGLMLPPNVQKALGSSPDARFMPGEMDDMVRAAGSFDTNEANAEERRNPHKKVSRTELSRDDQGNQVQINTYTDGSIEELPVKAKGVTAKGGANGGLTPFQQHTVGREDEADVHNRAMVWQNKMDKYEEEQSTLSKENIAHGQEMTELGTQLENGELPKKERAIAIRRKNLLGSLISGNNEKFKTLESQKKTAQKIKDSIRGANGMQPDQAATTTAAPANAAPKTATLGQVNKYAKQYNLDLATAQKAFEDQGITIAK